MTVHSMALREQPDDVGTYQRPPTGTVHVRAEGHRLAARGGGMGENDVPLVFWGLDLTYAEPEGDATYPYRGMPVEFIRGEDDRVGWIRVNGRIAAKES